MATNDESTAIHLKLLTDISDSMEVDSREYESFIEHMKRIIPKGVLASKKTLLKKLEAMAGKGKLDVGNYEHLNKIAVDSDNGELLEMISEAEQKLKTIQTNAVSVPEASPSDSWILQETKTTEQDTEHVVSQIPIDEINRLLLTDAAQSVLDMGYQPDMIKKAIEKVLVRDGRAGVSTTNIMTMIFEIEEEETVLIRDEMNDKTSIVGNQDIGAKDDSGPSISISVPDASPSSFRDVQITKNSEQENSIHLKLLTDISDSMEVDSREYESFIEHMKRIIPKGVLASKKTLLKKLEAMAGKGKLGVGNYEHLKKIAKDSDNGELLEIISEAEQKIKTIQSKAVSVPGASPSSSRDVQITKNSEQGVLPDEILRMDDKSIELYKKTLADGEVAVHNIRVMVVGHFDVGKTSLTRRLLDKNIDPDQLKSTDGIKVYVRRCQVSLEDRKWTVLKNDTKTENTFISLVKLMSQETMHLKNDVETKTIDDLSTLDDVTKEEYVDITPPTYETDLVAEDTHMKGIEEIKELIKHAENLRHDDLNNAELSIWDFAGQSAFYGTHQVFLSHRAVYLLVTDISKHIQDVVEEEDACYFDSTCSTYCKISEYVEFWLNSIHGYCASQNEGAPPVILVGTHADQLDEENKTEQSERYFDALSNVVVNQITYKHLVDENFAIDNTIIDPKLTDLKDKIVKVASEQQHWGELIPARWITLEKALNGIEEKGLKICTKQSLQQLNQALPVPLTSEEELSLFLRFQHDIGNIIYFSDAELCDHILLDPQWLVDAFKCLITAKRFVMNKPIKPKWLEFKKSAILSHELIDALWTQAEQPGFHKHRDQLIVLMERLDMIAKPRSFVADSDKIEVEDFFLVPCMLKTPPDSADLQPSTDATSTSIICFTMTTGFIPVAVFNRLLSSCLTLWPVSKQNKKYLIYCGVGVFDVDRQHRLTLFFSQNVIHLWVKKVSEKNPNPSKEVCTRVREFIKETFVKIKKQLRDTCEFKMRLKCPDVDLRSNDGMFDIEEFQTEDGEVSCHCHGNSHVLKSSDMLEDWGFKEADSQEELAEECRTVSDDEEEEEAVWQKALRKCYRKLVEDMQPMSILDRFQEIKFLPKTALRDIREHQKTSEKNRAIIDKVLTMGEQGYTAFKKCLQNTEENPGLADYLTDVEKQIKETTSYNHVASDDDVYHDEDQQQTSLLTADRHFQEPEVVLTRDNHNGYSFSHPRDRPNHICTALVAAIVFAIPILFLGLCYLAGFMTSLNKVAGDNEL